MPSVAATSCFDLSERCALVVGGGAAGVALAAALEAAGARTELAMPDEPDTDAAGREICRSPLSCDCPSQADASALIDRFVGQHEHIDVLVNAWRLPPMQPAIRMTPADWRQQVRLPLKCAFLTCQAAARRMLPRGGGSIINVSSLAGTLGMPDTLARSAFGGGINQLTRTLGVEWYDRGVRVNAIAASVLDPNDAPGDPTHTHESAEQHTVGRQLGGTAVYLAADAAAGVTGQILSIDGGYSSQ